MSRGIAEAAARSPEKPALILQDRTLSYGALERRINQTARALRAAHVGRNDRVAVATFNSFEWFELMNALGRLEALLVPLPYRAKGPEMAHLIADSEAKLVVADPGLSREVDRALDELSLSDDALYALGDGRPWRGRSWEERLAEESSEPLADARPGGGYHVLIYTSGTTGRPKGILRAPIPPERAADGMNGVAQMWGLRESDVHLAAGPLYHTAPSSQAQVHLNLGATVALLPRFDAAMCLEWIERYRVTTSQMVPAMFFRILALPEDVRARADLSSVRLLLHAAAPCPIDVKRRILDLFPEGSVWEFYGASEGGGTRISSEEWRERPGSVGRPWPGFEIRIRDEAGRDLPAGEVGTIYVSPPTGAGFSYKGDEEKTRAAIDGGAFTVGDMGSLDAEGYLYIADRKTDMIISGGANIYPAEVEQQLYRHPAVVDAAVFGIPDDEMGESVKAMVELRPDADVTSADLMAFCRRDLAHYKCPRTIDFVERLPRDPAGKVRKRTLREPYWSDRQTRV